MPLVVAAALMLFAASCGGSGGGDGGMVSTTCVDFTPATDPGVGKAVARENGGSCEEILLDLIVTDVDNLFAAEFTVTFNAALLTFQGLDATGSVLSSDGADVEVLQQPVSGSAVVGISRIDTMTGIDVVGQGKLISIRFRRFGPTGNGAVGFTGTTLLDGQAPPQAVPGIQWFGGTIVVR